MTAPIPPWRLDPDPLTIPEPWDHAYEADESDVCLTCGVVGSYGHTREYYERLRDRETQDDRAGIGWLVIIAAAIVVITAIVIVWFGAEWRPGREERPAATLAPAPSAGVAQSAERRLQAEVSGAKPDSGGTSLDGVPSPITVIGPPLVVERGVLPDTGTVLRGTATWCAPTPTHCQSWGGSAMKGAVQSFRYGDRPYRVKVCRIGTSRCAVVTIVSFCACGNTLVDLSPAAFRRLGPLYLGRIRVTMERVGGGSGPQQTVPPTSTGG